MKPDDPNPNMFMFYRLKANSNYCKDGIFQINKGCFVHLARMGLRPEYDYLEGFFWHMILVYTLPNERQKGYGLKAIKRVCAYAEEAGCGLTAVIKPSELTKKPKHWHNVSASLRDGEVIDASDPTGEKAASMANLLKQSGFQAGFDLARIGYFGQEDFPRDRMCAFLPDTMEPFFAEKTKVFLPSGILT